jgi:methylglutaconyl-CoA hydratase
MTDSSDTKPVRSHTESGVLTIAIDDPASRNALGSQTMRQLAAAIRSGGSRDDVRVIIITGQGKLFSSGGDLREAQSETTPDELYISLIDAIESAPKPVVARVNGPAYGGAIGVIAACDLSVAVETATFAFSEVRLGLAPTLTAVISVPKLRHCDASELILTGERFDGHRAADVGLVNRVAPVDEFDAAVGDLVRSLVAGAPGGLAACKALVRRLPNMPRNEAFSWAAQMSVSLAKGTEAQEGMTAFLEKRPPAWAVA